MEDNSIGSLRETLILQFPVLEQELDSGTIFLTHLAKLNLIEPIDVGKYEQIKDTLQRNKIIMEDLIVRKNEIPNDLAKFVECLHNSNQAPLARLLSSASHELLIAEQYQKKLEEQLIVVNNYLKKELRRVELRLNPIEEDTSINNVFLTSATDEECDAQVKTKEIIKTMQVTTKESIAQFDRCRDIIEKLHHDSNEVAHKNASMMAKLRDCDQLLKMILVKADIKAIEVNQSANEASTGSQAKHNDADLLAKNIKTNMDLLKTHLHCRQEDETLCIAVLDNMTADIRARKAALTVFCEVPARTDNKYVKAKLGNAKHSADNKKLLSRNTALRRRLDDLAEHLQSYVDMETLTVQKLTADLREGEIKRANETKSEKDEWMEKLRSIESIIDARRQKLIHDRTSSLTINDKESKRIQKRKKVRELQFSESAFIQQLYNIEENVHHYVSLEQDNAQRHRVEVLRLKTELETDLRLRSQQMREVERRLREIERDRDKYKRLYDKKTAQKSTANMVITRPTILKRSPRKDNMLSLQNMEPNREHRQPRLTSRAKRLTRLRSDFGELERKTVRVKPMPQQQTFQSFPVTSMTASVHKLHINDNISLAHNME